VTEETFVARFLLDPTVDTEESVANVDGFVALPDGMTWALTMVTVDEVRRLLAAWTECGEAGHGGDEIRGGVGAQPTNGQDVLNRSVGVGPNTTRRIGADPSTGEIVVFDETQPGQGIFHGHVRSWDQLTPGMRSVLIKAGQVTTKGRVVP
jgi:hypothetical protein